MKLAAIICALALCACAHDSPWLTKTTGCTPPYNLEILTLVHCTDLELGCAACVYEFREPGLHCVWQFERKGCAAFWDMTAHVCSTHTPYDDKSWSVPEGLGK